MTSPAVSSVARTRGVLVCAVATLLACAAPRSESSVPRVAITQSWARIADSGGTSGAYLDIANNDTVPITLVSVTTADAGAAEVHETMSHDGMTHMMPHTAMDIPAGGVLTMAPGGLHVMLIGVRRALTAGDSVRVVLHLSDSTQVTTTVPVKTP